MLERQDCVRIGGGLQRNIKYPGSSAAARRGYKLYSNSILQPATEHFNIKVLLTALWSSQKDIQETETVMEQGTYTVTMKKESWRANSSFTRKHEYVPGQLYWLEGIADRKINSIALKLLETLDLSKVLS